jgi:transcriptional regulator with AAA-type ATPase domain/tetratricopeptide (TPR) repeat protein
METFADLLGESRAIEAVRQSVRRLLTRAKGGRRLPAILIGGETGTGKGLVARLIHRHGPRAQGPFVDVNCAAIPETLLESELFGYERGAFTDARRAKPGLFQTAHRGTIFLDEVGLLPEALQAKLLKVLEEQAVRRLGSTSSEPIDVTIVSATNADLKSAVAARRFREDLYHRLAVLSLELPPLRERGEDVLMLARHFLSRACSEYGLAPKQLSSSAEARLLSYPWPGNIRELGNVMERVALLSEGDIVEGQMLELQEPPTAGAVDVGPGPAPDSDTIRDHLLAALERTKWNISHTATQLGLSRNTVRARIERYGLTASPGRPARKGVSAAAARVERAPVAPVRPPVPSAVRWEQRRVGFLRVDRIGAEAEGPSIEANRVLDTLIQKTEAFGGRLLEITTTGITAAFGLEPAEDAPRRAALTAMSLYKAVLRDEAVAEIGRTMTSAVHVAQVPFAQAGAVADIDGNAKRQAWSVLDALVATAEAGTTVVSQPATPLLARRFVVTPTAAREPNTGPVFRVIDYRPTPFDVGGNMGRFVGRDSELALLRSRLETARQGQGQLLALVGEAGIGKSRLLFQFRQELAAQGTVCLLGHCLSYGSSSPYHPLLEILRAAFRLAEMDTPVIMAEKVRRALDDAGVDPAQAAPCLHQLLGIKHASDELMALSPEIIKSRTFEALHTLFLRSSQGGPLVIVVEDLHWIDQLSEQYLASLVERIAGKPILLVVTYRPEYHAPWVLRSSGTQVTVQPLAPADSLTVVRGAFGTDQVAEPVAQLILTKAEGNPFFLEELARAAREQGATATLTAPETVQEVLLARIDRLPDSSRQLLQAAAVVGKDSTFEILRAITGTRVDTLRDRMGHLQSADFMYETNTFPQSEYTFRHALTREVAYASMPAGERRALHARILEAIQALHADRLVEHVERLAHHAFHGEVWERAVTHLRQAGAKALAGAAYSAAAAHFEQALVALSHLPETAETQEQAIDLRFEVRHALFPLGQPERGLQYLREAEGIARRLGDSQRLGWVSAYMCYYLLPKDLRESLTFGQRAHAIGEELDNLPLQVAGSYYVGLAHSNAGDYRSADQVLRRAIRLVDGSASAEGRGLIGFPVSMCRSWLAIVLANMGAFEEAIAHGLDGLHRAEGVDHPYTLIIACRNLAAVYTMRGELASAVRLLERGLALARDRHVTDLVPGVTARLGYALVLSGQIDKGLSLLADAVGLNESTGRRGSHSLLITYLAEGYLRAGRLEEALAGGEQALSHARKHAERGDEAHALRLHGELAARLEPAAETAAGHFREALELAGELHMQPLVAHCHLGLGTLWRRGGDQPRADEHLGTALKLFSEMGMSRWAEMAREAALG